MKTCTGCLEDKPLDQFAKRSRSKDGLTPWCSACRKLYFKGHYQRNQNAIKARSVRSKPVLVARNRQYVLAWKLAHPCVDCGEADPDVLDFDHVRGTKIRSVYEMVFAGFSLAKIQTEIDKCEVRCANDHRRVTRRRERELRNEQQPA